MIGLRSKLPTIHELSPRVVSVSVQVDETLIKPSIITSLVGVHLKQPLRIPVLGTKPSRNVGPLDKPISLRQNKTIKKKRSQVDSKINKKSISKNGFKKNDSKSSKNKQVFKIPYSFEIDSDSDFQIIDTKSSQTNQAITILNSCEIDNDYDLIQIDTKSSQTNQAIKIPNSCEIDNGSDCKIIDTKSSKNNQTITVLNSCEIDNDCDLIKIDTTKSSMNNQLITILNSCEIENDSDNSKPQIQDPLCNFPFKIQSTQTLLDDSFMKIIEKLGIPLIYLLKNDKLNSASLCKHGHADIALLINRYVAGHQKCISCNSRTSKTGRNNHSKMKVSKSSSKLTNSSNVSKQKVLKRSSSDGFQNVIGALKNERLKSNNKQISLSEGSILVKPKREVSCNMHCLSKLSMIRNHSPCFIASSGSLNNKSSNKLIENMSNHNNKMKRNVNGKRTCASSNDLTHTQKLNTDKWSLRDAKSFIAKECLKYCQQNNAKTVRKSIVRLDSMSHKKCPTKISKSTSQSTSKSISKSTSKSKNANLKGPIRDGSKIWNIMFPKDIE